MVGQERAGREQVLGLQLYQGVSCVGTCQGTRWVLLGPFRSRGGCEPCPICCVGAELEEVLLGLCEGSYNRFGRKREELRAFRSLHRQH